MDVCAVHGKLMLVDTDQMIIRAMGDGLLQLFHSPGNTNSSPPKLNG